MLRKLYVTVLIACFAAGAADASYTLDLIWADTGTRTLTVASGDANGTAAGTPCKNSPVAAGRCLSVQITAEKQWTAAISTLAWSEASSGITAAHIPTRTVGPFAIPGFIPIFPKPRDPGSCPTPACDTVVGSFGGVGNLNVAFGPGTYLIGSIHLDLSNTLRGQHEILHYFRTGVGGVADENYVEQPAQVNGAFVNAMPEPSGTLLFGTGLVVCSVAIRRRKRPRA